MSLCRDNSMLITFIVSSKNIIDLKCILMQNLSHKCPLVCITLYKMFNVFESNPVIVFLYALYYSDFVLTLWQKYFSNLTLQSSMQAVQWRSLVSPTLLTGPTLTEASRQNPASLLLCLNRTHFERTQTCWSWIFCSLVKPCVYFISCPPFKDVFITSFFTFIK